MLLDLINGISVSVVNGDCANLASLVESLGHSVNHVHLVSALEK
jgi:hypothetical protein